MRHLSRAASAAVWIPLFGLTLGGIGCVATASGRIYDPVCAGSEQNDYWKWRHNRPEPSNR